MNITESLFWFPALWVPVVLSWQVRATKRPLAAQENIGDSLRKPVIDDYTDVFWKWAQDREVTRYLSWKTHKSSEETRRFILQCIKDWESGSRFALMICLKPTKEVIRMIEFHIDHMFSKIR